MPHLPHRYLVVQGPPGTGKTHTAAGCIAELVRRGKRVGVMAVSHRAIVNLLARSLSMMAAGGGGGGDGEQAGSGGAICEAIKLGGTWCTPAPCTFPSAHC